MKKHLNLITVLMVVIAIAVVLGNLKGVPVPSARMFGFSSGG
jgi:small-conductance mechanosensitive channel